LINKLVLISLLLVCGVAFSYPNIQKNIFSQIECNSKYNTLKSDSVKFKKFIYPIDYRFFHYQVGIQMGGIKFINIGMNTQVYFQPIRFLALTGGVDIQYFRLKIFSSSDKHIINTGSLPMYYGGLIKLTNKFNSQKDYYLFAKRGISIGIGSESVKANNHPFLEIGIGKTFKQKSSCSYRLEASYQQYGVSGTALSSYQAIIDYDLMYRSVVMRASFVFHKY